MLSVLGRITSMADAESAIAAGVCDMVGAARQLIAEPEFVVHALARSGTPQPRMTSPAIGALPLPVMVRRELHDQPGQLPRACVGCD